MTERALKAPAPVTHYASVRAMAEWFAAAAPVRPMKYASGPSLDQREGAARLAGEWGRAGKVHPYQTRATPGVTDYWVRRLARAGEPVAAAAPQPQSLDAESPEGRVYALLRRCANLAQPCPSHEELAEKLDLKDRWQAKNKTQLLIDRGLIRVDWPARTGPIIVTIVATGKQTAGTAFGGKQTSFETRGARAPQDERNSDNERSR